VILYPNFGKLTPSIVQMDFIKLQHEINEFEFIYETFIRAMTAFVF